MTPKRARQLGVRWLVAAVALLVARTVAAAVGFDELSLPLTCAMWVSFIWAVGHQQWANGYDAHAKIREDA